MSDSTPREWRFYLDDMISFAEKVVAYTNGLDQASFVASGLAYDATLRNLELIGEPAAHIPDALQPAWVTTGPSASVAAPFMRSSVVLPLP